MDEYFSALSGIHLHQTSPIGRGLASLKSTILASKQNRMVDPLMVDHMLQGLCSSTALAALSAGGSGTAAGAGSASGTSGLVDLTGVEAFIDRYNASVNYDPSLMLVEKAATRQRNLLDPSKCSAEMKALMRSAVEDASAFEDTGMSLEILAQGEFWIGFVFVSSSHLQWVQLCRTSEASCLASLRALFAGKAKQRAYSAPGFKLLARRIAFATNVIQGTFGRRSVSRQICDSMFNRVLDGLYNDDIDNLINDCDDEAPQNDDLAMDAHLAEVCAFVQDVVELQEAETSANPEEQARAEAAASMGEAEWFMAELEHDLGSFLKARGAKDKLVESLCAKETEWQKLADVNVKEATSSFAQCHAPIVKYEANAFKKIVSACKDQIAKERQCEVKKVLAVYWLDLLGA